MIFKKNLDALTLQCYVACILYALYMLQFFLGTGEYTTVLLSDKYLPLVLLSDNTFVILSMQVHTKFLSFKVLARV